MGRELALVLLPGWRAQLRRATSELAEFERLVRAAPARALRDASWFERVEGVRAEVERLGWCLGALSAAQDVDLLYVRDEAHGLPWFLGALTEALSVELLPAVDELPLVRSSAAGGWRVAVLAAWAALRARGSAARELVWRVCVESEASWLVFERSASDALRSERTEVEALGGNAIRCDSERIALRLPAQKG